MSYSQPSSCLLLLSERDVYDVALQQGGSELHRSACLCQQALGASPLFCLLQSCSLVCWWWPQLHEHVHDHFSARFNSASFQLCCFFFLEVFTLGSVCSKYRILFKVTFICLPYSNTGRIGKDLTVRLKGRPSHQSRRPSIRGARDRALGRRAWGCSWTLTLEDGLYCWWLAWNVQHPEREDCWEGGSIGWKGKWCGVCRL